MQISTSTAGGIALQLVTVSAVVPPSPSEGAVAQHSEVHGGCAALGKLLYFEEVPSLVVAGSSQYCGRLQSTGCEPLTCTHEVSENVLSYFRMQKRREGARALSARRRIKSWVCSHLDNLLLL